MEGFENGLYQQHVRSTVPLEMQEAHRWVFALADKIPLNPNQPHSRASVTNPATWGDFDTALAIADAMGGEPGFVLGDGFVGIDLDDCRDPNTGELTEFAISVVKQLDSYCEVSVSGTGLHVLCLGKLPDGGRRALRIEMYDAERFFIVTANRVSGELQERTLQLKALHDAVFVDRSPRATESAVVATQLPDESVIERIQSSSNAKLLKLWNGDWSGYKSQSEADIALVTLLAQFTPDHDQLGRLVSLSGLSRDKWNRADYRTATVENAFKSIPTNRKSTVPLSSANRQSEPSRTDGSAIIECLTQLNPELFCSAEDQPYICVNLRGCKELFRISGVEFQQAVSALIHRQSNYIPSVTAINGAVSVLAAQARQAGRQPLFVRIARTDEHNLWFDLARPDHKVVHVTPSGWSVTTDTPVKFIRPSGMEPLPEPMATADSLLSSLRQLINVSSDEGLALVTGWLVGAMRGKGPYSVLCLTGEQGAAKSCTSRMLRRIIDPDLALLSRPPRTERDLLIRAKSSHVLAYDNISQIPQWLSDAFCSIATKTASTARKLYSDDAEAIISVSRPLLLNGITDFITRDDLLNRTMLVTLDPIASPSRKTESELDRLFERLLPGMLANLLDAAAASLRDESKTTVADCPRLADLAKWVAASETVVGWPAGTFVKALNQNQRNSVADNLEGDLLLSTLEGLSLPWKGTFKQLLDRIDECPQKPRNAKALGSLFRTKGPALRQQGFTFEFKRSNGARLIVLNRPSATVVGFR